MTMEQISPVSEITAGAMIRTLGLISMLSGFLVVLVHQTTMPYIEANRRAAIEKAISKVIPGAVSRATFTLTSDGLRKGEGSEGSEGRVVYAGYDRAGDLVGIATEAAAPGYADVVRVLYGYSRQCECITGIKVLQSKETPGLGDKIATDERFLANFVALDARLSADGTGLANPIVTVKHGTKTEPWQIDAIAGATVSSKAVGRMLNDSAQSSLPGIHAYWEELR